MAGRGSGARAMWLALAGYSVLFGVPGVRASHNSIAEQVGEQIHLGIHFEVDPTLSIVEADAIGDQVRTQLESDFDDIWVSVHVDPEVEGERGGRADSADAGPGGVDASDRTATL